MDEQNSAGRARVAVTVITLAVSAGSLALDLGGFFPNIDWRAVALVAIAIFAISMYWQMYELSQALHAKAPKIKMLQPFIADGMTFTEMPLIRESQSEEKTRKQPTWFAYAAFINQPRYGTENNHANDVVARLTYYSPGGKRLIGPMDGRWSGADVPKTPSDIQKIIRQQIKSDGLEVTLDLAVKPRGVAELYAYSNRNYFLQNMVDDSVKLSEKIVDVHILLTGVRMKREFWVRMYNHGAGGGLHIEKRGSRLARWLHGRKRNKQ